MVYEYLKMVYEYLDMVCEHLGMISGHLWIDFGHQKMHQMSFGACKGRNMPSSVVAVDWALIFGSPVANFLIFINI